MREIGIDLCKLYFLRIHVIFAEDLIDEKIQEILGEIDDLECLHEMGMLLY